jgi:chromosome segregation ATPase
VPVYNSGRTDDAERDMSTSPDQPTLHSVAEGLLADLRRLEDTIREAQKLEINSAKNLQRGRRLLEACSETEQRLAGHLQTLAQSIQSTQQRIATCMEETVQFSRRVASRAEIRSELLERLGGLGRRASEINAPVATAVAQQTAGTADNVSLLATVTEVVTRTEGLLEEAASVANEAKAAEWLDIARDADGLRQQVHSLRNKVLILQRGLAERAPS